MYKSISVIAAIVFLLAGCKSTPPGAEQAGAPVEDRLPGQAAATKPVESPTIAKVTPGAPPAQDPSLASALAALKDPSSPLAKRSVYFDFDSFLIKDEYKALVEAHARFLVTYPRMKTLIQGNADERGSREYNLALGQKRSDAVRNMLLLLGAKEDQIESVSLGEEKPRNPGRDEAAWAENRRGDILYTGEF